MLVLDKSDTEQMLFTLVNAGVPVTMASRMLGFSRAQGFYIIEQNKARSRTRRSYVSAKMVEMAETLIDRGLPLDVVVAATGLTGQQILDYLSSEEG